MILEHLIRSVCIIFIFYILLLFPVKKSFGQNGPWFKEKDKFIESCYHIEIFGGTISSNMRYSNIEVNSLKRNLLFQHDFGASYRIQKVKPFSFGARLSYYGQGVSMDTIPGYVIKANYISLSFPFEYQFNIIKVKKGSDAKSFFFFAPYIATPVSGSVVSGDYNEKLVSGENLKSFNWGAEVGFGIRIPTFSLEDKSNLNLRISWMQGLNDTYASNNNKVINQKLYVVDGSRFNSGLKLTVCIEIPFKSKKIVSFTAGGDGKKSYKRVVNVRD